MVTFLHAKTESDRCLQCFEAPCTAACPTHIDIPGFIAMLRSGNIRGAAERVKSANALANTCGKICPEEIFCQSVCTRARHDSAVRIRELHFYATQAECSEGYSIPRMGPARGTSVAVIGGGPAGLGCAFELAKLGHGVDVYNPGPPGGVPRNSIPPFRLAEKELASDTEFIGRYVATHDMKVDRGALQSIRETHRAVFLAVGLGRDRPLGIPGEDLPGVIPVLPYLELARRDPGVLSRAGRVIVIGGGNVSLDAAATARRLGAEEVTVLYRRGERQMRVWKSELEEARRQGVQFRFLASPVELLGRVAVEQLQCRGMRLTAELDSSGRQVPVEIPGSDFVLRGETVIVAIGQVIAADWLDFLGRTPGGLIAVDGRFATSIPGIFAGGDLVNGEGTIVQSVAHGKHAAWAIHEYLSRS